MMASQGSEEAVEGSRSDSLEQLTDHRWTDEIGCKSVVSELWGVLVFLGQSSSYP